MKKYQSILKDVKKIIQTNIFVWINFINVNLNVLVMKISMKMNGQTSEQSDPEKGWLTMKTS